MVKKQSKSARKDGRGGWIPGKRRNKALRDWDQVRDDLIAFFDSHSHRISCNRNVCAADLGVSYRTLGRWLSGEDLPAPERQRAAKQWLKKAKAKART